MQIRIIKIKNSAQTQVSQFSYWFFFTYPFAVQTLQPLLYTSSSPSPISSSLWLIDGCPTPVDVISHSSPSVRTHCQKIVFLWLWKPWGIWRPELNFSGHIESSSKLIKPGRDCPGKAGTNGIPNHQQWWKQPEELTPVIITFNDYKLSILMIGTHIQMINFSINHILWQTHRNATFVYTMAEDGKITKTCSEVKCIF
jgi:hypothetical protein